MGRQVPPRLREEGQQDLGPFFAEAERFFPSELLLFSSTLLLSTKAKCVSSFSLALPQRGAFPRLVPSSSGFKGIVSVLCVPVAFCSGKDAREGAEQGSDSLLLFSRKLSVRRFVGKPRSILSAPLHGPKRSFSHRSLALSDYKMLISTSRHREQGRSEAGSGHTAQPFFIFGRRVSVYFALLFFR